MQRSVKVIRYQPTVPADELEDAISLAAVATVALHGEARARLGVGYFHDLERRVIVCDCETRPGRDFTAILLGLLWTTFGDAAVSVEKHRTDSSAVA